MDSLHGHERLPYLLQVCPSKQRLTTSIVNNESRKYDAKDLRSLEMRYVAINYGLFLLPALVYLIMDLSPMHPNIYGGAGVSLPSQSDAMHSF